jgi:diguanylate cyclase (GGDEF)-like protein/PAS domain S-box-containing protein
MDKYNLDANKVEGSCASILVAPSEERFFDTQVNQFLQSDSTAAEFSCMSCFNQHAEEICLRLNLLKSSHKGTEYYLLTANEHSHDQQMLKRMKEELSLFSCAVRNTNSGIVITNEKREVLWLNNAFTIQTGYTLSEVKGKGLAKILQGPDTDKQTLERIKYLLLEEKGVDEQILNYHKNGHAYWNNLRITPIFKHGRLVRFVGVQHDVTNEVEIKESLNKLTVTLKDEVKKQTEELQKSNAVLHRIATTDPLTGALNRRTLRETETKEFNRAKRNKQPISLLLFDLDHFKQINDTYGHDAGDVVLITTVNTVVSAMRDTDYLFRMGGEEFLLLMPNTSEKEASLVANRLRQSIKQNVVKHRDESITVTASIAVLSHCGDINIDDSLRLIDKGLYEAKSLGRDQVVNTHCH